MPVTNVWQIGAGDAWRDYSPLFLAHDLMFLGPGRFGPYQPDRYRADAVAREFTPQRISAIASFSREVQPGDLVLFRRGYRLVALGVAAEEGYQHDPSFDDVYGWDLEHTHRVIWQDHLADEIASLQSGGALFASRKQIPTFTRVKDPQILEPIQHLFGLCRTRPLKPRPKTLPKPLSLDELGQALFSKGLAHQSVEQVQRAIERQRRLLGWYKEFGKASSRPDEHEVVAHMVLPLLLALGWSEQLLAVEWHKADAVGFWRTPTTAEKCVLLCEAKGLWHGLQGVLAQAEAYVRDLELDGCRQILITQGGRFYLHVRSSDGGWAEEPTGYLNVERVRTNHLAPPNTNAIDTLIALTPAGASRR
jgi:hypothetical protein